MKRFIAVVVMILATLVATNNYAFGQDQQPVNQPERVTVEITDLTPEQLAKVKARQALRETKEKIETAGEYAKWGHEVGVAVNETLAAVTEHTTKFADTDLGHYTMFLVAWRVIGKDFMGYVVGVPMLLIGMTILVWSYRRTCLPRTFLMEKDKDGNKKWGIYDPVKANSNASVSVFGTIAEGRTVHGEALSRGHWASMHGLIGLAYLIICMVIIF